MVGANLRGCGFEAAIPRLSETRNDPKSTEAGQNKVAKLDGMNGMRRVVMVCSTWNRFLEFPSKRQRAAHTKKAKRSQNAGAKMQRIESAQRCLHFAQVMSGIGLQRERLEGPKWAGS